jgi:type IV secretory pathway VirB10-like protein
MEIRTSTVAVIVASCITVGAAGVFLASRPSRAPQAAPAADIATGGVEQSEALVADPPPAPAAETASAEPKKVAPAAPARRAEAPRAPEQKPVQQIASAPPAPVYPPPTTAAPVARTEPRTEPTEPPEPIEPPEPKGPRFVDLVVSTDSVLGLEMQSAVTSEKARVEDEVLARVTRDVRVGDRVAIPAGSQARGEVTMVERGGKVRDKARLGIRFTSVVLADGTRVPIESDTIYREGDSPAAESTAKIGGGAIGGAILGGIFGGAKGAAIGAATGAGAGTAAVVAGGRNAATLPSGTPVTVRLVKPATVTVEE